MLSPVPEQFEQLGRSKRPKSARLSSARAVRKESHHPSRVLSARSSSAQAVGIFSSQSYLTRLQRRASSPKTAGPAGPEFALACSHWTTSSRLPGSAPKPPAHALSAQGGESRVPELRRTPADKLVTSGKGVAPVEEYRSHGQRHSQSH